MSFWLIHSSDTENGGFFNCLAEDGSVYDTNKYVWMLGRQVWTYSRLYNEIEAYRKKDILDVAQKAAEFLRRYAKRDDSRCYFSLTADGKPVKLQRTIFSESFYVMAMAEIGRATGNKEYEDEAVEMLRCIVKWHETGDLPDGHLPLEGRAECSPLSSPMIILGIVSQVCYCFPQHNAEFGHWKKTAVEEILKHIQRNGTVILENVTPQGQEMSGSAGRLMNPGHALEAGWFLLEYAEEIGSAELRNIALEKFIKLPYEIGWDKDHGGLFYFLDADGYTPVQLEWNMKLWWPICEAMISFLMAYKVTKDEQFFDTFKKVMKYALNSFKDAVHGEWYGYLNQRGCVTHNFKGGPFKGCFHVPRTLYMCQKMLNEIILELSASGNN